MSSTYLHLGGNTVIPAAEVVTIVDARLLGAEANRHLLEQAIAAGYLKEGGLQRCKALVVTTRGVYASTVSPQSLARRLGGFLPANG